MTAAIRDARTEDLSQVLALLRAAALPADGVVESFGAFAVAEHEGAVVGAAGLERYGDDALLRSLVVAPEWRGRGLGAELVGHVLARADEAGTRAVYLLTTTAEGISRVTASMSSRETTCRPACVNPSSSAARVPRRRR